MRNDSGVRSLHQVEWAAPRHQAIAAAAWDLLAESSKQKITKILAGSSLVQISTWADEIKRGHPQDPESVKFQADPRNKGNAAWHFVDLPLGCSSYGAPESIAFTRPDDIVHILRESIQAAKDGTGSRFSPLNALRLIVHLAGDIHQPLHVACGYLRPTANTFEIVASPKEAQADKLNSDHGGNLLILPNHLNLHEYWDGHLGDDKLSNETKERLSAATAATRPSSVDVSDLDSWPSDWATLSLVAARTAYEPLKVSPLTQGTRSVGSSDSTKGIKVEWTNGEESYKAQCLPIVRERLATAGKNLATLLGTIYP